MDISQRQYNYTPIPLDWVFSALVRMTFSHLLSNFSGVGTCEWPIYVAIWCVVSASLELM